MAVILKDHIKLFIPPIMIDLYRKIHGYIRSEEKARGKSRDLFYQLPKQNLIELFPGIQNVSITIPLLQIFREPGTLPLTELLILASICKYLKPRRIFEIGTYKGSSTLLMAINTQENTEIFTLDLYPAERQITKYPLEIGDITGLSFTVGEMYRSRGFEARIHQL